MSTTIPLRETDRESNTVHSYPHTHTHTHLELTILSVVHCASSVSAVTPTCTYPSHIQHTHNTCIHILYTYMYKVNTHIPIHVHVHYVYIR